MFDALSKGFRSAQLSLKGQTRLTEDNLEPALKEVRSSLLQADVELGVAKAFVERVRDTLLGEVVQLRAAKGKAGRAARDLTPQDHFIKACYDELVELMGPAEPELVLKQSPAVVMMVGLQGSGKTTTTGKLAKRFVDEGRKPLLVAADIYRPAAVEQLMVIGRKLHVPVFSIKGMKPVELCRMAVAQARSTGRDLVILDTAGRLAIDDTLMQELEGIKEATRPDEILFVADAMIGQDAVRTAAEFDRRLSFTGFVLTKLDGDARGGAALAIKHVTGKPVKFLGQGEELDKLERFRPEGLAQRILGMGDVVGLVEDFEKHADLEKVEKSATRMMEGRFTYDDFVDQMKTIRRMGSLKDLLGKLPGMSGLLDQIPAEALDDGELDRTMAIIGSMTNQERKQPDVMNAGRLRRIAKGSGRGLPEVQALHERFLQARQMMGAMLGGGGMGNLAKMMGGGLPGMGGGFPGMGGGMPGMGGLGGLAGMMGGGKPEKEREQLSADERRARKAKRKERTRSQKKNR